MNFIKYKEAQKALNEMRIRFAKSVEQGEKSSKHSDLKFLRGCPYFTNDKCSCICWNLMGPCGTCVKNGKYDPNNATKENFERFVLKKIKPQTR